ncbi:uncharacterized protein MONOS_11843 [Monocercomonoides exilis]|uniref:uncharacterized protein n=1 Tax=Monocercomonoides exilis TaxID=2049356 RepID=UPI00355A69FD|nr:hypothetical protein MONOS_11843 [Monocercomonoides exilis]|eukprot:MONOS_11843.1-p1 / transcript=MONOS_11843.1 / gene=MONOS_11843 / organism=Monocercomonoides_exilis_PA203 / gene_product=unspecified product / transcript_product=unspecified product / location=Mono_scaffold00617:32491-33376(+) / protein_length=204 / sequence_SO=supercontig / SO=protein_coding / is_pseudo=false
MCFVCPGLRKEVDTYYTAIADKARRVAVWGRKHAIALDAVPAFEHSEARFWGCRNPPSQIDDSDYFMSRARLLASMKITFGAMERRGSYFIPMNGNMWRESRGPLVTYTREGVRRLGERFEEMMAAKETDRLEAGEQIMHNQMCIDVTLGDVGEMLGLRCSEEGELLHRIRVEYACVYGELWKEQETGVAREERLREELRNKE